MDIFNFTAGDAGTYRFYSEGNVDLQVSEFNGVDVFSSGAQGDNDADGINFDWSIKFTANSTNTIEIYVYDQTQSTIENCVVYVSYEGETPTIPTTENWDGTSDIILGSIRHSGDDYKAAYTWTVTSDKGFGDVSTSNPKYNVIIGTPSNDEAGNAWYDAEYVMTNDENTSWVYSTTALPIFGPNENPGDVYVRRYFTTSEGAALPGTVYMPAPHNDAPCEYYINGTLVWSRTGNEPGIDGWYEDEIVRLTDEQKALIKTDGSVNVFAYHVHQNWGGRYADGGLYGDAGDVANAFNNNGDRKALEVAVKQAEKVSDFSEEVLAYAKNATVCLQDASRALNLVRYELMNRLAQHNNFYSEVASAEPADGLECWLYNVGTGMFLAGGNDKGTHASVESNLSSWPMVLHANTSGANRYTIQTNLPNGTRGINDGLGHNGYVDCENWNTTAEDWAWEFQAVGDGTYRIINSQNSGDNIYLGVTEDYRYQVDTDKAGADNPMNLWKIITRAQLDELIMNASFMHPADATHFIHQANFSQNDFDGNAKGAANADLNDSKWECNAGAIWNWKGNEADGDYVFEAKNTAADVDFKLSQTITGLKPGLYGVSCTGFYRDGDWASAVAGNKRQLASLYTKSPEYEGSVVLPSILDFAGKGAGYGRLESERVIPDDCRDAAKFFQYRAYYVEVEAIVGADGTLEIGVARPADESIKENDWIVVDNFRLTCLQLTGDNLEVPGNCMATYVAPFNVSELPEGLTVYAPLKHEGYVELQEIDAIPNGEAVVVQGEPGTYIMKRSDAAVELEVTNDLIAAVSPVIADGSQYILDSRDDVVGFYKVTEETTIPAKTAYLVISTDAKELFTFEEEGSGGETPTYTALSVGPNTVHIYDYYSEDTEYEDYLYTFTPEEPGVYTISFSDNDSPISVYAGFGDNANGMAASPDTPLTTPELTAGTTYLLYVDGDENDYTNATINITRVADENGNPIYTREMAYEWGTLCLPYPIKYNANNGNYKLYTLSDVATDALTFTEVANGTVIDAGIPMAVKAVGKKNAETDKYSISVVGQYVEEQAVFTKTIEVGDYVFRGTYEDMTDRADVYFIAQNHFWWAESAITIPANRAYLNGPGPTNGAKSFNIVVDDETTAINNEQLTINMAGAVFNLNGQKLSAPQRGINIINGRKVLVK